MIYSVYTQPIKIKGRLKNMTRGLLEHRKDHKHNWKPGEYIWPQHRTIKNSRSRLEPTYIKVLKIEYYNYVS